MMDAMSRADDTIQIHTFLLDTKITKCRGQRPCTKGFRVQGEHGQGDFPVQFLETGDWRADIFNYLKDPAQGAPRKI
jgi:hypothetical protein